MHLIRQKQNSTTCQWDYISKIRQDGIPQRPEDIKTGGYYLYKEKHGMVALVKVIKKVSCAGWVDFTLLVKRVLFSPWEVRKGTVFEVGLDLNFTTYPSSWHFEAGMAVIKSSTTRLAELQESCSAETGRVSVNE